MAEAGGQPRRRVFYGWVMVALCCVTVAVVFGIRLGYGVFFVALNEEFGWGRGATASVFALSMVVFALTAAPVGVALDRWGPRLVCGAGGVFLAVGLALCSRVETLWQLQLAYGVVASIGITILGLATEAAIIARWFIRRRGLAFGMVFAGSGLGTLILTPTIERLIAGLGWRGAYVALAVLAGVVIVAASRGLVRRPEDVGQWPDDADGPVVVRAVQARRAAGQAAAVGRGWTWGEAARTVQFWLLVVAALGAIGPLRMLTVHQVAYAVDAGFSRFFAASMFGAGGALTALTFVVSGFLSDRLGRRRTYVVGSMCLGAAVLALLQVRGTADVVWLYLYTLLYAVGEGARSSIVTAIASDLFPGESLGAINGTMGAAFGAGAAVATWMAGALFDVTGSYGLALWVALAAMVVSAVCIAVVQPPQRRRAAEVPMAAGE